jgi:hypothetical protein
LCKAYAAGNGAERGGKLDATGFEELAEAAGGEERVADFCEDLLPGDQKLKKTRQPDPSRSGGQNQGGPSASTGGGGGQGQGGASSQDQRVP